MDQWHPESSCHLLDKIWADIRSAKTGWLWLTIICYMLSNISRAYRWRLLIGGEFGQTKFSNIFWSIMVGYFTNLAVPDRKSTRLNSSHVAISYSVFCLKH